MRKLLIAVGVVAAVMVGFLLLGYSQLSDFQDGITAYNQGDYGTASKEFRVFASRGLDRAQNNLGVMYDKGQGVTQDYKEAVKWYRKAAEQGIAPAQMNLGRMYLIGRGVTPDNVHAYMWFNIVIANGYEKLRKSRDIAEKPMTSAQIAEAQKLAREWMAKHQK